jgi:hypothetical protein
MAQDFSFEKKLYDNYDNWLEKALTYRRFKHSDIQPLIGRLKTDGIFSVSAAGVSEQGREISLIKMGNGPVKAFMWSQMHGDEPTSTMALFDLFNFFRDGLRFTDEKKKILEGVTLYIIPMLNPDGAELFQRRNINRIDINRDAIKQQSAEGRILKTVFDSLKPEFGFNLHDQSGRYSVGPTPKTAAFSFLAPPFNKEKDTNQVRNKAIGLIGRLNSMLNSFIPGRIAKYSDDFEARAFGDNFQKWGMSTVLIESGGWPGDAEKQFLRKLNFVTLVSALKSISSKNYQDISPAEYESIPFNDNLIYDLLLRNVTINYGRSPAKIDIAVNRVEKNTPDMRSFFYEGIIEEMGDAGGRFGIEEFDMEGYELLPGKVYPEEFDSHGQVEQLNFTELYKEGYIFVKVKNADSLNLNCAPCRLPINVISSSATPFNYNINVEENASFILAKNGVAEYACINGFFINTAAPKGGVINGSRFR